MSVNLKIPLFRVGDGVKYLKLGRVFWIGVKILFQCFRSREYFQFEFSHHAYDKKQHYHFSRDTRSVNVPFWLMRRKTSGALKDLVYWTGYIWFKVSLVQNPRWSLSRSFRRVVYISIKEESFIIVVVSFGKGFESSILSNELEMLRYQPTENSNSRC